MIAVLMAMIVAVADDSGLPPPDAGFLKANSADRRVMIQAILAKPLGSPADLGTLLQGAIDEDEEVRWKSDAAIARFDALAVPVLAQAIRSDDVKTRRASALALAALGRSARGALADLQHGATDPDALVRCRCLQTLGQIGGDEVVLILTKSLKDSDLDVRRVSVLGLAKLGPKARSASLSLARLVVRDSDPNLRRLAADALGRVGSLAIEAVPTLIQGLTDRELMVRQSCFRAIQRVGPESIPVLTHALENPNDAIRIAAANSLKDFGPIAKGASEPLHRLLEHSNAKVRRAAGDALLSIQNP